MLNMDLEFSECDMRYIHVIIEGSEIINIDLMEYFYPEYFLYKEDKEKWDIYEKFKDAYHVFKFFNN